MSPLFPPKPLLDFSLTSNTLKTVKISPLNSPDLPSPLCVINVWIRPGHTDLGKKDYFFFAPIWKAPEYILNLRRQLIRMIFKHAGDPPKFGRFTVTKHPYLRALTPKKSKRKKSMFHMS